MHAQDHIITIPDGRKVHVQCIGTVCLSNGITLREVLYVLEFHFNLVSVNKLCQNLSCHILFTSTGCFIQANLTTTPWLLGRSTHGLYQTDARVHFSSKKIVPALVSQDCTPSHKIDSCNITHHIKKDCTSKLWHLRLGHMPMHLMKRLFPSLLIDSNYFCTICPVAKQTRLHFSHSVTHNSHPLDLIHIDIWGPYKFPTRQSHIGFMTLVDDHTRFTWTYLIKHKSEFPSLFKQFVFLVENQFYSKVKSIRSDNAKELTEGNALLFYRQHGIFLQTSC